MKARRLLAAPFLAGALVLAACGGGGSGEAPGGQATDEPTLAPITAVDINPQDRATLQQGGEVRLAVSDLGTNWNPLHIDGNNNELTGIRNALLPNFFLFDAKGVPTPNPNFVESTTVKTVTPTVVEFKLNPKAVWGDGSPVSGADMTAMWKACSGENKKFNCASTDGFDQIADIKTVDDFDVTLTFKSTYNDWQAPWGPVLKADSIKDADTFNNGWKTLKNAWLSGPFKVQGVDQTQKVVTEVPNDKWWGDKPLLDKISFRVVATDATPNAFVNNEIDSFDVGPDPNGFKLASGVSDGTIRKAAGPNWRQITVNSKAGALTDKAVRQAIVLGLDRIAIASSDLAGIDWPARELNNLILLENQQGYQDSAAKTGLNFDVEKAKSTLDAAGWTAGSDGMRAKDGKPLEIKFSALDGVPASQNEALQTQNQLKDVGIKVDIVQVPPDKFNTTLSSHSFELIAFTWVGTPFPFNNINQLYGTGSESNYAQLSLPEVDDLATKIKTEADQAKRIEMANQISAILWENVHTIPLYQRPELIAVKTKLANYGAVGLVNQPKWEDVGYQK